MALPLSEVVNVNISLSSAAVPQPAFSVDLIIGTSARIAGVIKYYASQTALASMITDGFLVTDPEYKRAAELIQQAIQPVNFGVSCNAVTSVAQTSVITMSSGPTNGFIYTITINGIPFSYTAVVPSDTTAIVLTALAGLINAAIGLNVKATYSATQIALVAYNASIQVTTITQGANWPGRVFTVAFAGTGAGQLVNTPGAANASLADYLLTILPVDAGFYSINICSVNWYDIMNMAALVEAQTLIFIASSSDAAIPLSTCLYDVASQLKALGYTRTALLYSGQASSGADAGWTGTSIAIVPGASTWSNTPISGITPDALTPSIFGIISPPPGTAGGKNGNTYVTIGGNNLVLYGQMASGRFIDITVGIDWLKSQIQTRIFASIIAARAAGGKIPYTNKGTTIFLGNVREAIDLGATNGLIDPTQGVTISAPDVSTMSTTDKTNRVAPTVSFHCTLSGAYSTVTVNGVVSV